MGPRQSFTRQMTCRLLKRWKPFLLFLKAPAKSGGAKHIHWDWSPLECASNPYGADIAPNPEKIRQTMARYDPRHFSLFGAAWAVGAVAATQRFDIRSMALASPSGPFGIVSFDGGQHNTSKRKQAKCMLPRFFTPFGFWTTISKNERRRVRKPF